MPTEPLYDKIHRQFSALVRNFPTEQGLKEFLEEVPIPETVGTLLPDARDVAEMLKVAPTEQFAVQELRADEARTRIFYQFAMSQFQTLREHPASKSLVTTDSDTPFCELASWILALTDQRQ